LTAGFFSKVGGKTVNMNPNPSFTVVESLSRSKYGEPELGDDRLVITSNFVAVLDGATEASGARYNGLSSGQFVVKIGAQALESLAPDSHATIAVEKITQVVREALLEVKPDKNPNHTPCFAIVVFSAARREIWRVGDCQYLLDGEAYNPIIQVDQITSQLRSLIVRSHLAQGKTIEDLLKDDPSQNLLVPFYRLQTALRNHPEEPFGYAAIDGTRVPERYLEVIKIPEQVKSIVLASDGYPDLRATLTDSETVLTKILTQDPLCYSLYLGQRGLAPGRESFDDRTYVRLELHDY
jgi:ribosomal protein L37AE/L43A